MTEHNEVEFLGKVREVEALIDDLRGPEGLASWSMARHLKAGQAWATADLLARFVLGRDAW